MRSFAAGKRPQLSLEELCLLRWVLGGTLALLSVWTLFYQPGAIWPLALVGTIAIASVIAWPVIPSRVPKWMWRLGVPVIAGVAVMDLMTNELFVALVRLNVLLVLFRAVSYRGRREDLQLVILCLFLIVLSGVMTVSLVFAAQILLFTGAAMGLLFVVNVVNDATGGLEPVPWRWTRMRKRRFWMRLWQVCDLRLMVLAVALFAAVVLVSSIIFMAIPRFQMDSGVNLMAFNKGGTLTGFSEVIALGEVTDIKQDNTIAMRVDAKGVSGVPAVPYWRMVVLDEYQRGTFRVSSSVTDLVGGRSQQHLDLSPAVAARERAGERPRSPGDGRKAETGNQASARIEPERYVVFMEGGISRYLPHPGGFSEIHFKELQEIVSNDLFQVYATNRQSAVLLSYQIEGADFSGVMPDPVFAAMIREGGEAGKNARLDRAGDGVREAEAQRFEGGETSPESGRRKATPRRIEGRAMDGEQPGSEGEVRYPATLLAVPVSEAAQAYLTGEVERITNGETLGAAEFAKRACEYLDRTHVYSTVSALPTSNIEEDPVIRWMQGGLGGHCEFFAAAFALLSRAAGHPTRTVAGFKGGTWNEFESYFMVRHSDAHAWCEVFDGKGAWLRVDPTPGAEGVVSTTGAPRFEVRRTDGSTSAYLDSLRMLWYRRIVNFDERSQRGVARTLGDLWTTVRVWSSAVATVLWDQYKEWETKPWSFSNKGDMLYTSIVMFLVAVAMKRMGVGTSDVLEWFRTGNPATRRRAGDLLRRLEARAAKPRWRRRWDEALAMDLAEQLMVIRYGRVESWPDTLRVFRAVRRMI